LCDQSSGWKSFGPLSFRLFFLSLASSPAPRSAIFLHADQAFQGIYYFSLMFFSIVLPAPPPSRAVTKSDRQSYSSIQPTFTLNLVVCGFSLFFWLLDDLPRVFFKAPSVCSWKICSTDNIPQFLRVDPFPYRFSYFCANATPAAFEISSSGRSVNRLFSFIQTALVCFFDFHFMIRCLKSVCSLVLTRGPPVLPTHAILPPIKVMSYRDVMREHRGQKSAF